MNKRQRKELLEKLEDLVSKEMAKHEGVDIYCSFHLSLEKNLSAGIVDITSSVFKTPTKNINLNK
jgi:hypothetical protein